MDDQYDCYDEDFNERPNKSEYDEWRQMDYAQRYRDAT